VVTVAVGTLVLLAFRLPRRADIIGLAAAAAAVLIAIQLCLSYYSYSYVLWFAPLVLVASVLWTPTGPRSARPHTVAPPAPAG
jgi:hypothetical protein